MRKRNGKDIQMIHEIFTVGSRPSVLYSLNAELFGRRSIKAATLLPELARSHSISWPSIALYIVTYNCSKFC